MRRKEEETRKRGNGSKKDKNIKPDGRVRLKRLERGNNLDKKEILRIGIKEERWKCVNKRRRKKEGRRELKKGTETLLRKEG